jgi:hypothetical protein
MATAAESKNASCFSVCSCLSQACLGKIIVLMYKWLRKGVFRTGKLLSQTVRDEIHRAEYRPRLQKPPFGLNFSYLCPEPVLANE